MNYGSFSADGREFIIDNVQTPSPWINYLENGKYFATISNNGGGISYFKSPLHGRITRYRINDVPPDRPGKYIYLKDKQSGELWSLTWQPVGRHADAYRVAHGLGYTRVESRINDIEAHLRYFVPLDANCEIWQATIKNTGTHQKELDLYGYVEFALGHALIDLINQCDDQHFNRVHFDKQRNALFATKTYWVTESNGTQQQENKAWDHWAYFTSNRPVQSFETLRERFIGPYRNENNPLAIEKGRLSSRETDYGNAIGALHSELTLQPGQQETVVFVLGVLPKEQFEAGKTEIDRYKKPEQIDKAFADLKDSWEGFIGHARVQTPDRNVNIFMNYWMPYQAKTAFDVGRVASYYYWGISRGFGFRDTSQDVIAVTISRPKLARERIRLLARQMFKSGRVYHHFYADGHGETTRHCDDPLWFILAVTDYIKETGDFAILEHREPFVDSDESSTILDHLMTTVHFAENNLGKHGLPVFGRGDWNDTLDYIGGDEGGESVWGAMFYVAMLNALIDLLAKIGAQRDEQYTRSVRDRLRASIDLHCWDGRWYIRAFGQEDRKIGSVECRSGQIFLNPQIWAVLAGLPDKQRLDSALNSVAEKLVCTNGPKICAPAYTEIDPTIGLVTRCVPGKKENGAVFCHPTTWLIQAECMMGHGDRAFKYYKMMLPNSTDSDDYVTEPYVFPQYITSDEHSQPGRASHSWQTGTGAWMFRISLDYIIGIRASYEGLTVDPVIPAEWDGFTMKRVFRGREYNITVKNPDHVQRGVRQILVNNKQISGTVLPVCEDTTYDVTVIMG